MTEKKIIHALYKHYIGTTRHKCAVHNTTVLIAKSGEADFVTVSPSNYVTEVEVKVSRGDYLADFRNKPKKHYGYQNLAKGSGVSKWINYPNYFCFAVPEGMIKAADVPVQYGLIYISKTGALTIVRRPKILHRNKATSKNLETVAHLLSYKVTNLLK